MYNLVVLTGFAAVRVYSFEKGSIDAKVARSPSPKTFKGVSMG